MPPVRRFLPYLLRTRTGSLILHDTVIDLTRTLPWIEAFNAARGDRPHATLFSLLVWTCARALHARPRLNRFVSNGRLYQRRGVQIAFAAKRAFRDDAPFATVKLEMPTDESFAACVDRLHAGVAESRGDRERAVDREVRWLARAPGFLLRAGLALARWLDRRNLWPASMIRTDPMFSTLFLANLGSVGIDRAYHHLYEYGTTGLFGAVGTVGLRPTVTPEGTIEARPGVEIRWSFDERVEDGFYCAGTLRLVTAVLADPEAHVGPASDSADGRPPPAAPPGAGTPPEPR